MGINKGALFGAFRATCKAFSRSDSLGPKDLDHRVPCDLKGNCNDGEVERSTGGGGMSWGGGKLKEVRMG